MRGVHRSNPNRNVARLCFAVGLAVLFLSSFLWINVVIAHPATLPPATEAVAPASLNNGNVITIGVGAAMSLVPGIGWRQVNAVRLAVDQVNADGGVTIAGTAYSLALVAADGCNPAEGEASANTLLGAGAVAVVGYTCSGASNAAQPIHAAAGVPMVSPSASMPGLTEQGYTTTFRVNSRDDSPWIALPTYLHTRQNHQRAAIVERAGFWGNDANDVISPTFTSLGGIITSRRTVAATADFTATLAAIQAENPDVIFYADDDPANAALLSQVAHGLGMTAVPIAWTTFTDAEDTLNTYAAQAGAAAEGDYATLLSLRPQDMAGYDAFNAAYQAAGFPNQGDEATAWGAYAYDAANLIIAAMTRAQSAEPSAIRQALTDTANYPGVVGVYQGFDAKGDAIPQWLWLGRYEGGAWRIVHAARVFLPLTLK